MDSSHSYDDPPLHSEHRHQTRDVEARPFLRMVVRCLFPLLICESLSLGWWVPALYNWSGDDQSRTPPIVGYVFKGFYIACALAIVGLSLLPRLQRIKPVRDPLIRLFKLRFFNSRTIAIIAVVIAAGLMMFHTATLVSIYMALLGYPLLCAMKLWVLSPSLRWRIVSLYCCLYCPFVWIFGNDVLQGAIQQGNWSFVPLLAAAPSLLFSMYIWRFNNSHFVIAPMLAVAVVGLEVIVGLWINQLGARRAAAYQILLLAASVAASYGFYALLRA